MLPLIKKFIQFSVWSGFRKTLNFSYGFLSLEESVFNLIKFYADFEKLGNRKYQGLLLKDYGIVLYSFFKIYILRTFFNFTNEKF